MGRTKKNVKVALELQIGGALSYLDKLTMKEWDIWLCDKLNKFKWPYAKLSEKAKRDADEVEASYDTAEVKFNLTIHMDGGYGTFPWLGSVVHWNPFRKILTIRDVDDYDHIIKYPLKELSQEAVLELAMCIVQYSKSKGKSNE